MPECLLMYFTITFWPETGRLYIIGHWMSIVRLSIDRLKTGLTSFPSPRILG